MGTSDAAFGDGMFGDVSPLIIRLISSGDGIPGVGVAPFLTPFFISASLGIPGVGVAPFGIFAITVGMPGAPAFVAIGAALSPGGKLLLSSLTSVADLFEFEFAFDAVEPPHDMAIAVAIKRIKRAKIRIILERC